MSRSLGVRSLTTRSPIEIVPALISSSPAIMRSSVVLPHPEGPTRTVNSPSAISQAEVVHRHGSVAVALAHVLDLDCGHAVRLLRGCLADQRRRASRRAAPWGMSSLRAACRAKAIAPRSAAWSPSRLVSMRAVSGTSAAAAPRTGLQQQRARADAAAEHDQLRVEDRAHGGDGRAQPGGDVLHHRPGVAVPGAGRARTRPGRSRPRPCAQAPARRSRRARPPRRSRPPGLRAACAAGRTGPRRAAGRRSRRPPRGRHARARRA